MTDTATLELAVSQKGTRYALSKVRLWPFTLKLGIVIVAIVVLAGICAPLLTPYDPIRGDYNDTLTPPGLQHPFGTDSYGRDLFSRTLYAARLDIQIGPRPGRIRASRKLCPQ